MNIKKYFIWIGAALLLLISGLWIISSYVKPTNQKLAASKSFQGEQLNVAQAIEQNDPQAVKHYAINTDLNTPARMILRCCFTP